MTRLLTITLLMTPPLPCTAQTVVAWLDGGMGQSRWFNGATEPRLRYGALGLRAAWNPPGPLGARASLGGGVGSDDAGGSGWWNGDAGLWLGRRLGSALGRVAVEGWGLRYEQALRYEAAGVRLTPSLDWRAGRWTVRTRGEFVTGSWWLEQERLPGPPPVPGPGSGDPGTERGSHRMFGGAVDLLHTRGPVWLRAGTAAWRARGRVVDQWQHGAEAEATLLAGPVTLSAGGRWVSLVPEEGADRTGTLGGVARARLALSQDWALTAAYDGLPWDPMHAVQRGSAVAVGFEWRWLPVRRRTTPVIELGSWTDTGRAVRFRLGPVRSERVELLGDFSGWEPVAMTRRAETWEAEVILAPGVHQFAFLLDGETWMVPDHAPGIVTDGWQRRNATVVIPERTP